MLAACNDNRHNQPQRIHHDVPLASVDVFCGILTAFRTTASVVSADGLAWMPAAGIGFLPLI
jgi:hypothetical protein